MNISGFNTKNGCIGKPFFHITETDEYERLVKFFIENELEYDAEDEVDTDVVTCYKVTYGNDRLAGACCLAKREGEFIIDGIAVDKDFRKHKIGKIMLDKLVSVTKKLGGSEIYLVARTPDFFRTYGFGTVDPKNAPNFFECKHCDQYGETCHPEVMKYVIRD